MITAGMLMAVTIAGALYSVSARNVLRAIFGLAVALFGVAGIFLILNSAFVAAMEILIYVGGISVAMIFAVMLSTVVAQRDDGAKRRLLAALASIGFFVTVAYVIHKTPFGEESVTTDQDWAVAELGRDLLSHYNLVFEVLSVVLLLAIIGAVAISRRDRAASDEPASGGES